MHLSQEGENVNPPLVFHTMNLVMQVKGLGRAEAGCCKGDIEISGGEIRLMALGIGNVFSR